MVSNALAGIQPVYLVIAGSVVFLLLLSLLLHAKKTRRRGHAPPAGSAPNVLSGVLLSSRPEHDVRGAAKSTAWSVIVHVCVVAALVSLTLKSERAEAVGDHYVELTPEPPPPPPPPPPPAPIPMEDVQAPADILKGTQVLSIPDIVPDHIPQPRLGVSIKAEDFSGIGPEGGRAGGREGARPNSDIAAGPIFIKRTREPELKNTDEVQRVLMRTYPPLLRDSGIGGTVLLWFLIDENGKVVKTQLKESSGHSSLDEAAARVAEIMVFNPAKNLDKNVPVWVAIPILFQTR